jgi:alpha-beta hydrolase superfamily lysophospholipase
VSNPTPSFIICKVLSNVTDIFLIRPPEGVAHRPVRPDRIVIAGDSAGGGLSLALLQVIRDSGLPAPAGGVLISPWCDFTHSFPSVFTNTDTVRLSSLTLCFTYRVVISLGRDTSYRSLPAQA